MIRTLLAPWIAVREAREHAERLYRRLDLQRGITEAREREAAAYRIERDLAREQLAADRAKRSRAVSIGNRTKALRRRGALLPEPITPASQPTRGHD